MSLLGQHKILTYWSDSREEYISFSPTLLKLSNRFLLEIPTMGSSDDVEEAFKQGLKNSLRIIERLKELGIDVNLID